MIAFNLGPMRTQTVNIRLTRINESSLQGIALMFKRLAGNISASAFEINWYTNGKNSRLASSGKKLQRDIAFRVNLISHREEC